MQQRGFWANVSLLGLSVILLLAWGVLPLFVTGNPGRPEPSDARQETESSLDPSDTALRGSDVVTQLDRLDPAHKANHVLFQSAWNLVALAGMSGVVSGTIALWWPIWEMQAAFVGVVCGVVCLVCLGFVRFQYANMTSTSLFDTTGVGWWVLVSAGACLVAQAGIRPRRRVAVAVPQPPPFLQQPAQEIFAAIPTELSAARRTMPQLRLVHLGTNHNYSFDLLQPVSIGRSRQNDIVLTDEKVSRRHAVIRWQDGWILIANHSQHAPLYVNQYPIDGEQALMAGDTITLGQTHLRLLGDDAG